MRYLIAAALAAFAALPADAPAQTRTPASGPADITRHAGASGSPILQAVEVPAGARTLYLSGMLPDPVDPARAGAPDLAIADYGDTRTQTVSTLNKIKRALEARGYSMRDAIKMTVYVAGDPALGGRMDFAGMNAGFRTFFGTADNPNTVSRSTIQVAALAGPAYLVEIEVTAAKLP